MPIILSINTSFETASVILSSGEKIIEEIQHSSQKDHTSFLEPAIQTLFRHANLSMQNIDAISVVNGPGSYTGLRIGLSSAKALCYSLNKPLILVNTLDVMALALKLQLLGNDNDTLFCPLIDARRMEVFTALYDSNLNIVIPYSAQILTKDFLNDYLTPDKKIIVGGSGADKLKTLTNKENFIYVSCLNIAQPLIKMGLKSFTNKAFANISYSEPFYCKPVYFNK